MVNLEQPLNQNENTNQTQTVRPELTGTYQILQSKLQELPLKEEIRKEARFLLLQYEQLVDSYTVLNQANKDKVERDLLESMRAFIAHHFHRGRRVV